MIRMKEKSSMSRVLTDAFTSSVKALPFVDQSLALQDIVRGTHTRLPGAEQGQAIATRGLLAPIAPLYTALDTAIDVGGSIVTGGSPLKAAVGLEPHRISEFIPEKIKKIKLPSVAGGGITQIAADTLRGKPIGMDYTVGGVAPVAEEVGKIALAGGVQRAISSNKTKMLKETEEIIRIRLVSAGKTPNEAEDLARFTVYESIKRKGGLDKVSIRDIKASRDILQKAIKQPKIKLKRIGGPHAQDIKATGEVIKRPTVVPSKDQPLRYPLGKAGEARIGGEGDKPPERIKMPFPSTTEAVTKGMESADKPEQLAEWQKLRDDALAEIQEIKKLPKKTRDDLQYGADKAVEAQLYREAIEGAKGTHGIVKELEQKGVRRAVKTPQEVIETIPKEGVERPSKEEIRVRDVEKGKKALIKPDFQRPETKAEEKAWVDIVKKHQALKPTGKEDVFGKYAKPEDIPTDQQIEMTQESIREENFISDYVKGKKISVYDKYLEEEIKGLPGRYRKPSGGAKFDEVLQGLRDSGYEFDDVAALSEYLKAHIKNKSVLRSKLKKLQSVSKEQKVVKKKVKPFEELGKPKKLKAAISEGVGKVKVADILNLKRSLQRQEQASREGAVFGKAEQQKRERIIKARQEMQSMVKDIHSLKTDKMSPVAKKNIEEIQDMLDVAKPSKRTLYRLGSLRKAMEANPDMELPDYVLTNLERLEKMNASDMTMDQLRSLHATVKHYAKLESLKNKIKTKQKIRDHREVVSQSIAEMKPLEEATGEVDVTKVKKSTKMDKVKNFLTISQDHYDLITESIAGEDSTIHDVMYKQVKKGIIKSYVLRQELEDKFLKGLKESDVKNIPKWKEQPVKEGRFTLTHGQRVSVYLHSLNEGNLRHLKNGFSFPTERKINVFKEGELDKLLESITPEEKAIAKIHKDIADRVYDMLAEVFYEKNGYELPKVENHFSVKIARGAMPDKQEASSAIDELRDNYVRIGLRKGYLNKRKAGAQQPLILEDYFDAINKHIDHTTTYAALEIPLANASKLLYDKNFRSALEQRYGKVVWKELEKGLRDISGQQANFSDFEKGLLELKNKATKVIYGLNLGVWVKQTLSAPLFNVYVPAPYLIQSLGDHFNNAEAINKRHLKYSPEYRERVKRGFDVDVYDVTASKAGKKLSGGKQDIGDALMWGTKKFDKLTVSRGMHAAVLQKMDELKGSDLSMEERLKEAYEWADEVVENTQPMFSKEHRSPMQRGSASEKILTFATSATGQQLNLIRRTHRKWKRTGDPKDFTAFVKSVIFASLIIPIGNAIYDVGADITYRREFKDIKAPNLIASIIKGNAAMIPIVREIVGSALSRMQGYFGADVGNPVGDIAQSMADTFYYTLSGLGGKPKNLAKGIDKAIELYLGLSYGFPYRNAKKLSKRALQVGLLGGYMIGQKLAGEEPKKKIKMKSKLKLKKKLKLIDK